MPENKASVSVIIPCFRCKETIERSVESIVAQSLLPEEIILVDDNSRDGTLELLYELSERYDDGWIKVIAQPENSGPGSARNRGWDLANCCYVAFLDADDCWHPDKVELQYLWMKQNPEVHISGHKIGTSKNSKSKLTVGFSNNKLDALSVKNVTFNRQLWSNSFITSSVMVNRKVNIRFIEGKYHSEDFLLWLEILKRFGSGAVIQEPLLFALKPAFSGDGLSGALWKMQKGQIDTYKRLYRKGLITKRKYPILILWSWMRFVRRIIIRSVR